MTEQRHSRPGPEQPLQNRRRLIKAAAGLPAMMTLASGAAQALTSSQTCALSAGGNPLTAADAPLNTTSTGATTSTNSNAAVYSCDAMTTSGLVTPPDGWPTASPANTYYNTGYTTPIRQYTTFSNHPDQACVLFVYQDPTSGQLVSTLNGTTNQNALPVTASCYASFTLSQGG